MGVNEWLLTDWSTLDFEEKKQPEQPEQPKQEAQKGDCPKCGRHIGRGAHNHIKACDGTPAEAR